MSVTSVKLKTHSREDLTDQFQLNECVVHNCKPQIMDIIAGRRKEHHYVAICKSDDCCKLSSESGQQVVDYWNKWNPLKLKK